MPGSVCAACLLLRTVCRPEGQCLRQGRRGPPGSLEVGPAERRGCALGLARGARRRQPRGLARPLRLVRRQRALRRSEEHTSELQSLMRISYAVFCLKKKINKTE